LLAIILERVEGARGNQYRRQLSLKRKTAHELATIIGKAWKVSRQNVLLALDDV